jgi:hypothetical protein
MASSTQANPSPGAIPTQLSPRSRLLLLALIAAATAVVHAGVTESGFKKDDFLHLYDRASLGHWNFIRLPHGGHVMVVHKLLLDALLRVFGLQATAILAVFVFLHVVNAVLLQGILERFTGRPVPSSLVTVAWSTAPIHQTTLAWISTHGHVLVGTFVLLVLWEIAGLVRDGGKPSYAALLRWSALLFAAVCSFGVGLTIAASAPLWIWLLLRAGTFEWRKWIPLLALVGLAIGAFLFGRRTGGDVTRTDVVQALPAVLALFLELAAYGFAATAGASFLTLRPDDRAVWPFGELGMTGALALSYAVALVLALVLVRAFVAGDRSTRRLLLGCVLVSCAAYGAVALGRGSSLLGKGPEWFATRAKYHYASSLGFVVALGIALARLPWRATPLPLASAGALALGLVVTNGAAARQMDDGFGAEARLAMAFVDGALAKAVEEAPAREVYVVNAPFLPARHILIAKRRESAFPGIFAYTAIAHPGFLLGGRELFFVEEDPQVLEWTRLRRRGPVAAHLVSPAEAIARGAQAIHDVRTGRTTPARPQDQGR